MKKFLLIIFILLVFVAAGGFGSLWVFWRQPISQSSEEVTIEIRPGDTHRTFVDSMVQKDIMINAVKYRIAARLFGNRTVKVGEYLIRKDMSPAQISTLVSSGKSLSYAVTVPEGYNLFEIAQILQGTKYIDSKEFLRIARDPNSAKRYVNQDSVSLEGYLFPDTYNITKYTGAAGLIQMMVDKFNQNFSTVGPSPIKLTKHQVVTLASIIEKETGAPEERPMISSVFHNRIAKGMRLQTDPTVIYGIWERDGIWNGKIGRDDLTRPTRYNTYVISGLPPGPIANPGLAALRAAVQPDKSEFLFFVSRNDGTHVFSKDLAQHDRAVKDFQLNKKAREGKSWRDLNKRKNGK